MPRSVVAAITNAKGTDVTEHVPPIAISYRDRIRRATLRRGRHGVRRSRAALTLTRSAFAFVGGLTLAARSLRSSPHSTTLPTFPSFAKTLGRDFGFAILCRQLVRFSYFLRDLRWASPTPARTTDKHRYTRIKIKLFWSGTSSHQSTRNVPSQSLFLVPKVRLGTHRREALLRKTFRV